MTGSVKKGNFPRLMYEGKRGTVDSYVDYIGEKAHHQTSRIYNSLTRARLATINI